MATSLPLALCWGRVSRSDLTICHKASVVNNWFRAPISELTSMFFYLITRVASIHPIMIDLSLLNSKSLLSVPCMSK